MEIAPYLHGVVSFARSLLLADLCQYFWGIMKHFSFSVVVGLLLATGCGGSDQPTAPAAKAPAPAAPPPTAAPAAPADPAPASADGAVDAFAGCPAAMAEYDAFVDQYISYMKKAAEGDVSALAEAPALMEQANKAGTELAAAQGDLTVDCLKKYNEINKKMTDAALEMSGASAADKADVEDALEAAEEAAEALEDLEDAVEALDDAAEAAACIEECQGISDATEAANCMAGCM